MAIRNYMHRSLDISIDIKVFQCLIPRRCPDVCRAGEWEFEPQVDNGVRRAVRADKGLNVAIYYAGGQHEDGHGLHSVAVAFANSACYECICAIPTDLCLSRQN